MAMKENIWLPFVHWRCSHFSSSHWQHDDHKQHKWNRNVKEVEKFWRAVELEHGHSWEVLRKGNANAIWNRCMSCRTHAPPSESGKTCLRLRVVSKEGRSRFYCSMGRIGLRPLSGCQSHLAVLSLCSSAVFLFRYKIIKASGSNIFFKFIPCLLLTASHATCLLKPAIC